MSSTAARRAILVLLPFVDVLTEIGIASAFPQLRAAYGSAFQASLMVAVSPLFAVLTGWLWGALAKRASIGRVVGGAMLGWAAVTMILGLTIGRFVPALALRALQGTFSAGFVALPFIVFARHARGERERTKSFGTLETSASAGAIVAPVSVGAVLAVAPQTVLIVLGGVMLVVVVPWLRGAPTGADVPPGPEGEMPPGRVIARRVFVPTVFAAGIALVLGAFETLIPTVVEDTFGSVLAGFPVGAAVTMGNEYAAARVEGSEDVGMGLYSTLRITGSFLGPLFMNIRYPAVLAALAAVALACAGLVRAGAGSHRNPKAV